MFVSIRLKSAEDCEIVRRSVINTQERFSLRLDLVGQEAVDFAALKKSRGLKQHTELMRLLIQEAEEKANIINPRESGGPKRGRR